MYFIEHDIFDYGYKQSLSLLFSKGQEVSPRGIKTLELSPFVFRLYSPRTRFIQNANRDINLGLNIVEFLNIIGGNNSVSIFDGLSENIKKFSDDGVTFRGGYGPRLRNEEIDQFKLVIDKLKSDSFSRQAIMTIFDPAIDYVETKDVPCTINFHFLLRNNRLKMNVYMRSNDAILGHAIDIFVFTMIQEVIANELGVELGEYNHFVGSFHLYEKDFIKAEKIINNTDKFEEMPKMVGKLGDAWRCYSHVVQNYEWRLFHDYWNDLKLSVLYQKKLKNKEQIDINKLNDKIYKQYFERKLLWQEN